MSQDKPNEVETTEQQEIPQEHEPNGLGIVGDTTNHDLIMTRIWVKDNICENITISVLGKEFTKTRAQKVERHLKGKSIDDIEFIVGYNTLRKKDELSFPLDILFESIYRALDDYHRRQEMPPEETFQPEETQSENVNEGLNENL